jgi:hypothetical protein
MDAKLWNKMFRIVFLLLCCLSFAGCNKDASNDLIVFDVTANYPVKTLDLEDLAEIEYLTLEINDDFLFKYYDSMTDNYIICTGSDEIIFFDRSTGKAVSKVSRRGNGPGEYNFFSNYVYDERKDELFLLDQCEIKVYGKDGTFKRKFPFVKNLYYPYKLFDYDEDNLLFYGFPSRIFVYPEEKNNSLKDTSFMLVSKYDGFDEVLPIPFEERIPIVFSQNSAGTLAVVYPVVRNGNDFMLTDYSSDTVFRFTPDRQLIPVLVREPPVQKQKIKTFLHSWLETKPYLFFSTQQLDIDWKTLKFPSAKGYLMEKKSGQFYQTNIQIRDYNGYELILGPSVIYRTPSPQTGLIVWKAWELKEANRDNKLSGKLKEVTDHLSEDDEWVFMFLK